jgi:cell wall-associated NlpC family hydrolase
VIRVPAALALGAGLLVVLVLALAGCAGPKRVMTRPPAAAPAHPRQPAPPVQEPSSPPTSAQPSPAPHAQPPPSLSELAPSPRPRAGLAPAKDAAGAAELREVDEDIANTLAAVGLAQQLIGRPYRYGGRTPIGGFDCSGLVQYVFGEQGLDLPRTARRQARAGRHVERQELEPGDLVFFRIGGEQINHVGIYSGDGEFIHAPRSGRAVCRESLHNPWWQRRYAGARRVP